MASTEIRFRLEKPLDEAALERLARLHSVYGIHRARPSEDLREITVDYDASRLTPDQVEALLRRFGLAAVPEPGAA